MAFILPSFQDPFGLLPVSRNGDSFGPGRSTAILEPTTWQAAEGGVAPADLGAWYRQFVPYENLANNETIAERAKHFVLEHKRQYDSKTAQELQSKWKLAWASYQGRTASGYAGKPGVKVPVHVPEYWKQVETIAPRLEEPFVRSSPSFNVWGRDKLDRQKAARIRVLLEYQLQKNREAETNAEANRIGPMIGFVAWKTWHAVETKKVVKPNRTRKVVDGVVTYPSNPTEETIISYMGPRMALIDPAWFLIDTSNANAQEARFVGDTRFMTLNEIAHYAEMGAFSSAWRQLIHQKPVFARYQGDIVRQQRSLTGNYDWPTSWREPEGTAPQFPVTEIWGLFDVFGTGEARECVITVANEGVILRVQENFYFDKHRPYVVWKTCPHPFEFHTMAPLDPVIPLNAELDRLRQRMDRAIALMASPPLISDEHFDYPGGLWAVPEGGIIPGNPDRTKPLILNIDITGLRFREEATRRDISEATGVARIQQSGAAEGGGTATESTQQIQESNRRLFAMILSRARARGELLQQFHALNRQYMTTAQSLRVLGRDAAILGDHTEIGPDEIDVDADFEFIGLRTARSSGLEQANLASFFQMASGLLQANPQLAMDIDWKALLRFALDATIGQFSGSEIVKMDDDYGPLVPAEHENWILMADQEIAVHPDDDDAEHIRTHMEAAGEGPTPQMAKHILEHEAQRQTKAARQKAVAAKAAMQPQQQGAAGTPGEGSAPVIEPPVPSESSMAETPGPPNASRMRKPGRRMTPSQTEGVGLR